MFPLPKRYISGAVFLIVFFTLSAFLYSQDDTYYRFKQISFHQSSGFVAKWSQRQERYPLEKFKRIPSGKPVKFPDIQVSTIVETVDQRTLRRNRLVAVKQSFIHSWTGYKNHAWLADELMPVSGGKTGHFGGWAATLVDSLDTLWIMELYQEFDEAVRAVAEIDFESSTSDTLNVFETTIRYLGGLLSAYELSGRNELLHQAVKLGHLLYAAFDTPSRMPIPYFDWKNAWDMGDQDTVNHEISADLGSLCMEFTKLSQLTGDMRFYDATQRITELLAQQQNSTRIPGLWPLFVNTKDQNFTVGDEFSIGAMADSLYEYLPKMDIMLGGLQPEYGQMYAKAIEAAKETLFFRPMTKDNQDILFSGTGIMTPSGFRLDPSAQHLVCFTGGMLGMMAQIYQVPENLEVARKLTNGCNWGYTSTKSGIMPETIQAVKCPNATECLWDENVWHEEVRAAAGLNQDEDLQEYIAHHNIPPGFAAITDDQYKLRPEAIESLFYMYRITGDREWQDKAWNMYLAIERATRAEFGYSAVLNAAAEIPSQNDSMESFWLAETLKYLYLIFSDLDIISLDEFVLTTEAHPFRRMLPKKGLW